MKPSPTGLDCPPMRLGYLNTRYPALSHTFIQREIEALRDRGVEIVPFSIRKPTVAELGLGADAEEIHRTIYLLDTRLRFLWRSLAAGLAAPWRALRAIRASQRLSPGGLRPRLRHVVYALEGMVLARLMRRQDLGFVHVHMANNGAAVALLATSYDSRIRYALTIHGSAEFFDVFRLALREKAERASFVRFISECGRAQIMSLTSRATWSRFHVVHCGLDHLDWDPRPVRRDGPFRILAIGRLTAIKGFPILFEAVAALLERGVTWELRLAGDGPDRGDLEELASSLGIQAQVDFLGPVAPAVLKQEFAIADVLVVSSFMEGIPVVLMEAMAAGLPVVSTRVGGVPELVTDEVSGLLVAPGSSAALADALSRVHTDPQGAAARAVIGRETIAREFALKSTTSALQQLLGQYMPAGRNATLETGST